MAIDDKSLDYLASHLKQQNRMQFLKSAGNKNIKGVASYGLLETKDEAIENEIIFSIAKISLIFKLLNIDQTKHGL